MKEKRGFLTVDYDDCKQSTFKGLKINVSGSKKVIKFNTGDPIIDWYDYYKFIYGGEAYKQGFYSIGQSSNVDHWFMDGKKYIEKCLKQINEDSYEFYTDDEVMQMSFSSLNKCLKCVVTKKMKTFQDLKDYYKKHKK